MRIITLTAIPPRFKYLKENLKYLTRQEGVDEIRLYISKKYKRFPEYKGELPEVPEGVKLIQIDEDYGPATKLLPALKEFKNQDVQILFCDDDIKYYQGWAKRLFDEQSKRPNEAVALYGRAIKGNLPGIKHKPKQPQPVYRKVEKDYIYRFKRLIYRIFKTSPPLWKPIKKSGYTDMLFGVWGVVVKPNFFDEEVFNIPEEAWAVDDVWLSANLAKNNIPLYCPANLPIPEASEASTIESLLNMEIENKKRQELNTQAAKYCQQKFNIWR